MFNKASEEFKSLRQDSRQEVQHVYSRINQQKRLSYLDENDGQGNQQEDFAPCHVG